MKSNTEKTTKEEIEKAKHYLLDSQRNIERLKSGKKPRRKLKFILNEHRFLVFMLGLMIILAAMTPFYIPKPPPIIEDPLQVTVEDALNLIQANFTNHHQLPINRELETSPSSRLIILSSLATSLLMQTNYIPDDNYLFEKIRQIIGIIDNDTFVEYTNSSEILSIDNQFFGIYALLQANHVTKYTAYSMEIQGVYTALQKALNTYYSEELEMMIEPGRNKSFLIDQAIAMFTIATFALVTETDYFGGYSLYDVLQNLIYKITENFFNSSTESFYHEFDISTNISSTSANVESLIYLVLGLAKSDKRFPYDIDYTYFTPYSLHQDISTWKVDEEWIVHNYYDFDSDVLIKNQALFTLCSYLIGLDNVGFETLNATIEHFLKEEGFIDTFSSQEVTCESCLYGLISIACEKWVDIQNSREGRYLPTEESMYYIPILALVIILIFIRRRKNRF